MTPADYLINGLICIIGLMLFHLYFNKFLQREPIRPLYYWATLIGGYGILYLVPYLGYVELNMGASLVVQGAMVAFLFYGDYKEKTYYFVIWYVLGILAEFIITAVVGILIWTDILVLNGHYMNYVGMILAKLILIILLKIAERLLNYDKSTMTGNYLVPFLMMPLASIIFIQLMWSITMRYTLNSLEHFSIVLGGIILVFANFFTLYLMEQVMHSAKQQQEYEAMQTKMIFHQRYVEQLEATNYQNHMSLHDVKNHLKVMAGLADEASQPVLLQYTQQLDDDWQQHQDQYRTGHKVLDILLKEKHQIAQDKEITFTVNCQMVDLSFISYNDMVSLMGNILDNALEAAVDSESPWIMVEISQINQFMLKIKVSNSCAKQPEQENEQWLTTKTTGHHGYGLKIIKQTIERYHGDLYTQYHAEKKQFEIIVSLSSEKSRL